MNGKKSIRDDVIVRELQQKNRVDVEELSRILGVNVSTIRRDLVRLEKKGILRRIHGGAVPVDPFAYSGYTSGLTFHANMRKEATEKTAIAHAAAQLIKAGDSIAITPGTTTTLLARAIHHFQISKLTVVTSAVNVAMELIGLPDLNLILTGGLVLPDFYALVGPITEQNLTQMFVAKAFMGITGISLEQGLSGPNQLEAFAHRATMQRARQVIVLADHTKLGHVAPHFVAPIEAMHHLITDRGAPPDFLAALETRGITVQIV